MIQQQMTAVTHKTCLSLHISSPARSFQLSQHSAVQRVTILQQTPAKFMGHQVRVCAHVFSPFLPVRSTTRKRMASTPTKPAVMPKKVPARQLKYQSHATIIEIMR